MLKKVAVSVLLLLTVSCQTFAMSSVNTHTIQDAQEYGRRLAYEAYASFLFPWTAFEEKAQKLSAVTENALIFTPYLLVAADAREKALTNQPILLENSENTLAQYDGYLVFKVTLHSQDPSRLAKISAKLVQGKQTLPAYFISPLAKTQHTVNGKVLTRAQFYLYFVDKTISLNRPIILVLADATNHNRSFFFDLEKIL